MQQNDSLADGCNNHAKEHDDLHCEGQPRLCDANLAAGGTVILLHPPLPPSGSFNGDGEGVSAT